MPSKRQEPTKHSAKKTRTVHPKDERISLLTLLKRIGIVLLLLLPTYLSIGHYFYQKNNATTVQEVYYTQVQIVGPTGVTAVADDTPTEDKKPPLLLSAFSQMLTQKSPLASIPASHSTQYRVTMRTNTGEVKSFTFYFSPASPVAYYTDTEGNAWQSSAEAASPFLNSTYAFELYPQSIPPVLRTAATEVILPRELTWHYRTQKDFAPLTQVKTTEETLTYQIANDIAFDFSLLPHMHEIVISKDGAELYRGSKDNIPPLQLSLGMELDFSISATYNPDSSLDYYGSATYLFRMRVVEAASFTPDHTQTKAGQFVLLCCRNVANEKNLILSAEPAFDRAPVIFKRGDLVYAVIPAGDTSREITASYGTVSDSFTLNVIPTVGRTHALSATELRGDFTAALDGGLAALIDQYGASGDSALFTLTTPLSGYALPPRFAFGDTLAIDAVPTSKPLPFELYAFSGAVKAMAPGKVVQTGEDPLLGRFVILDHGAGLYSWYCGLSQLRITTHFVGVGDVIGYTGQTGLGLSGQDGVLILTTFGKSAVSPAYLRERAVFTP